jgi:acetolactate synthase-1/3 small subunit
VAPAEEANFSRITIVVDVESVTVEQIVKQLFKLIEVSRSASSTRATRSSASADGHRAHDDPGVEAHRPGESQRGQVVELVNIFEGKILAVGVDAVTVSLEGHPDKLDDFEELLSGYGIVELQRTGRVALPKLDREARLRAVKGRAG